MALFQRKKNPTLVALKEVFRRKERYRPLEVLGSGGLARVRRVFDQYLNRIVAIKELKRECADDADLTRAFITEARLVSFLNHPGIVPIYDSFIANDDHLSFTMQVVDGQTLTALLTDPATGADRALPIAQATEIFSKICETMAYAHDRGVIHLDLKPDNIMIGGYGEVRIMDWGSARLYNPQPYRSHLGRFLDDSVELSLDQESLTMILGTPQYMSPEQTISPRHLLLPASDVFSLGTLLYLMLTGNHPFPGEDIHGVIGQIRSCTPLLPHEINSAIPRRLSQICGRMMEKEPPRRYPHCREVMADLADFNNSGQAFPTRHFDRGDIIFEEGAQGDYAFFIVNGAVEISKKFEGHKKILAVLQKNEIVGELAIFGRQARSATACALEPTTIRIMHQDDVRKELDKLSPWVERMVAGMSKRFDGLNQKILEGAR